MIYSYRVTAGQEHIVLDMLVNKVNKTPEDVYGVFIFPDVKGYLFVEVKDISTARNLSQGIPHIKGVLPRPVPTAEVVRMAEKTAQIISVSKGDTVEFTSGPFKGERARVKRVDDTKGTITVELIEAAVPVPVTAKSGTVKLIQKAQTEE